MHGLESIVFRRSACVLHKINSHDKVKGWVNEEIWKNEKKKKNMSGLISNWYGSYSYAFPRTTTSWDPVFCVRDILYSTKTTSSRAAWHIVYSKPVCQLVHYSLIIAFPSQEKTLHSVVTALRESPTFFHSSPSDWFFFFLCCCQHPG